jgi:peptide/nickel transport system substrate-binding protein
MYEIRSERRVGWATRRREAFLVDLDLGRKGGNYRMKPKLPNKWLGALTAAAALSLAFVFVPAATAGGSTGGGTFIVAQPWGTIPDNFNPYAPSGANAPGTRSILYQSLYYINAATGAQTPLLGTSYKWSANSRQLTVTTRSGVTWSDGKPFSAADVAFTFNYLKANPALDLNGVWTSPLTSVTATGPNTVVFRFSKPDVPEAVTILYGTDGSPTDILPQHVWQSITDPATYTNTNPVATGPFTLSSFSTTSVIYTKNANYWEAGHPYINEVVFNSVDSDTTAELELENGTIDMSYDYITDAVRTFVDKSKSTNVYFWPVSNMNYLYMNTAKAPFNSVSFRKAVAMTMNTSFLAGRAYFGALSAASGGAEAAVVQPQLAKWFSGPLTSLEYVFNPTKARATLKAAGFKWSSSGALESPAGRPYPSMTVLIGGPGWTDYISLADNVSLELKAIGIKSTVIQEPYSTYANDLEKGHYDFAISWGNGNSATPYFQYYYMFSPKESAPIGKVANTDWERYTSPVITKALTTYATNSSVSVQKAAMATIEKNVLQNVPVVPLTGRANWLDYQTRSFTGFPTVSNPYNDGSASDQEGAMLVYLNVQQK